jgi:hypothetical protein
VSHTLGCFDWSLASLCRSASIVIWTLKTSLNVGVPVENWVPVGKDESGLWVGKLVATSQLCL